MYYKVRLYKIDEYEINEPKYVSHILVKKKTKDTIFFSKCREVLTDTYIDILPEYGYKDEYDRIKRIYLNRDFIEKYGFQLIIFDNDIIPENIITEEDLNNYIEEFNQESNKFEMIYTFMKRQDKKEIKKIRSKIKEFKKSQKGSN